MINVNCLGLLYCTHYALPLIRDGGGGDVVNVVLGRRADRRARIGRLQHDQVGRRRLLGVAPPGGRPHRRARHLRRAGLVETELQGHNKNPMVVERIEKMKEKTGQGPRVGGHRQRDRLRARPAQARLDQRDPRAAEHLDPVGGDMKRLDNGSGGRRRGSGVRARRLPTPRRATRCSASRTSLTRRWRTRRSTADRSIQTRKTAWTAARSRSIASAAVPTTRSAPHSRSRISRTSTSGASLKFKEPKQGTYYAKVAGTAKCKGDKSNTLKYPPANR